MSLPVWDPKVPPSLPPWFGDSGSFGGWSLILSLGLKSYTLYLQFLGPKHLLSLGLCGHQFYSTSRCPDLSTTSTHLALSRPTGVGTQSQGSTQMAPRPACHPVGPWLFSKAARVAGSSLGLLLGLGGYSLPNTVLTPIKCCQPAWAEDPVKAGLNPRRSRASAAEATSQSRACSKGLWEF